MALSQVQCLDDNHVNPRTHESKPEFLYCEDQRLALEAFLRDGREAFFRYLRARGLRGFLSDPELDTLAGAVEPFDPGSELLSPGNAGDDGPPLSLDYWPELSDTSVPDMDLGWPDLQSYRGVTRTAVYSQPPLDGQPHVKETVRKMIGQAQKVIGVVMDVFTDVDIFRDLLDAGFKRKVSVYILLERTTLPHFLSMCQRANMHAGHLKHLRVRCTEGAEFYTRSSTKVRGRMGHRFMFIDGDKAVSGSYSFTWMSSRLDTSLITVVTGQAVEAFDRLFRVLYATSSSVDFRKVPMEPEPEPEPLPQLASVAPPSAAIARKLYNPKYSLVTLGNHSPTSSSGSPKETQNPENSENPEVPKTKNRRGKACKEAIQEAPPIHPGLSNLEKACLMAYLPTWPEPDPASDVIGFINIRDSSRPTQVHLQRSEMFGTSQAIKFSSPFSVPKETLPEVAKPRQFTSKYEDMSKPQQAQDKTKAEESVVDRAQTTQRSAGPGDLRSQAEAPKQKSPASAPNFESDKDTTKTLNTENKLKSNTPTNRDAGLNTTPHLNAYTPPQSSSKASTPNTGRPSHTTQTVTADIPEPDSLPGPNSKKEAESRLNTQSAVVYRAHTVESNSTQPSHLRGPTDSSTEQHTQTKTVLPHTDSHTQSVHTQPQNSSEMTPNIQTPTVNSHVSSSSSSPMCSQSENNHVSITTSMTTGAPLTSISSSSSLLPGTSSSTALKSPLPSTSAMGEAAPLTAAPPIPKPRTMQLVINGSDVTSDGLKLPELSVIRRPETSRVTLVVHSESAVATVVQKLPEKEPETVPELRNNSGSKTGAQKVLKNTGNIEEANRSGTSQETKNEKEVGLHDDRAGMQLVAGTNLEAQSHVLITDAPKAESVNILEIIPKDVEPKTLTPIDCKLTPETADRIATVQTEAKAPERAQTGWEFAEVPNEKIKNVSQCNTYLANAHELQRISDCELTPQHVGVLETVDSLTAPTHTPVSASHNPHISKDDSTHNTHSTSQERIPNARGSTHTPEKSLRLQLTETHMPDLRSPEREARLPLALIRTPVPDGGRAPTPDSRTHTPDPRSCTPDFRTPTPDVSDGYVSPLSTTSEEYYECSDSPFHEPVSDRAAYRNHGTTEDHVGFTHTNTSPACVNDDTPVAPLGTTGRNTSSGETQRLKMGETTNEENGREVDEKGRKLSVAERRSGEEAKRTADHFKQAKDSSETVEKIKEAQSQAPQRKKLLNQSAAEGSVDGGVTPGKLTNVGAEPKRLSTGDLKPKKVSSEGGRPDEEKAVDRVAVGPGVEERSDQTQSTREPEGRKLLHTPPKTPRGQQQDISSRPSRPPRLLSATQLLAARPWGSSELNQAESKGLHGAFQVLDNASSPRRLPPRPPPPAAAGRKQAEVSHSQQSLLSRQTLAAQGKARAGQSPNQHPYPKPQASFPHTRSDIQTQLHPHSQSQTVSEQRETRCQEVGRSPFSFTFSRLYNLKGLKDKMSKLPAQSKRGSTSSPVQGRKSTS